MLQDIANEFKDLGPREKFLTLAALIAFPVDVVALLGLLGQILSFQQNTDTHEARPSAIVIGLPSFVWDTRIADVISLAILIYSIIVALIFLYYVNLGRISRLQLETFSTLAGGKERYLSQLKQKQDLPHFQEIDHESHILAAFLAALTIIPLAAPLLIIWLRVYVLNYFPFFSVLLLLSLCQIVFTCTFLSHRKQPYARRYFNRRGLDFLYLIMNTTTSPLKSLLTIITSVILMRLLRKAPKSMRLLPFH